MNTLARPTPVSASRYREDDSIWCSWFVFAISSSRLRRAARSPSEARSAPSNNSPAGPMRTILAASFSPIRSAVKGKRRSPFKPIGSTVVGGLCSAHLFETLKPGAPKTPPPCETTRSPESGRGSGARRGCQSGPENRASTVGVALVVGSAGRHSQGRASQAIDRPRVTPLWVFTELGA